METFSFSKDKYRLEKSTNFGSKRVKRKIWKKITTFVFINDILEIKFSE